MDGLEENKRRETRGGGKEKRRKKGKKRGICACAEECGGDLRTSKTLEKSRMEDGFKTPSHVYEGHALELAVP